MELSILMSAFLGLVQGLAEFLPISSSGHLSIIQNLFGLNYVEEEHMLFDVMLHLGTLVAVFVAYWPELREMIIDTFSVLTGKTEPTNEAGYVKPSIRNVILIIAATFPMALLLPVHKHIDELYYNTPFVAFALIVTGILLYISGKLTEGRKNEKTTTVLDVIVIGLAQVMAAIPGLSRSGATITVGMARGLKKSYAVKFSFFMSIPAVLGSVVVSLFSAIKEGIVWSNVPAYFVGMVVSGVTGYFAIIILKKIVNSNKFDRFAYYCWGAGIITLILSAVL